MKEIDKKRRVFLSIIRKKRIFTLDDGLIGSEE